MRSVELQRGRWSEGGKAVEGGALRAAPAPPRGLASMPPDTELSLSIPTRTKDKGTAPHEATPLDMPGSPTWGGWLELLSGLP
jgi:hypothetical protein